MHVISVHVPKTGGKSLRRLLLARYGDVRDDNADGIANPDSPFNRDRERYVEDFRAKNPTLTEPAVHGHFWLPKYEHIRGLRITFLRHPVARTISNFNHFRTVPQSTSKRPYKIREDVLSGRLALREFAMLPTFRRFYSQTIFGGVNMDKFDFIGRFEHYDLGITALRDLLGTGAEALHENRSSPTERLELDAGLLSEDIEFYERWTGKHA